MSPVKQSRTLRQGRRQVYRSGGAWKVRAREIFGVSTREVRAIFFLRKGECYFNLKSSSKVERECFCEVVKAVKLILVMPATNAVSENEL